MSPEEDSLARVITLFDRLAIPYMLTGSVASSYHGRPRATHDADVVIDPTPEQVDQLVQALVDDGFYVDLDRAREALRHRGQFNAIETRHACKIDLIMRRDRLFSREEFSRRQRADLTFMRAVALVTPEDAILSKLEWARKSGDSQKQLADAASIVDLNSTNIDRPYIERWARELGVLDLWRELG